MRHKAILVDAINKGRTVRFAGGRTANTVDELDAQIASEGANSAVQTPEVNREAFLRPESGVVRTPESALPATGIPLPDDFPGRRQLAADGHTTLEAVRALSLDRLKEINGIAEKTAQDIVNARGEA